MRILQIINGYSAGGAETLVRNLAGQFRAMGHDVFIIVLFAADVIKTDVDYEIGFKKDLSSIGVRHETLIRSKSRMIRDSIRMRRMIGDFKPDIVHVHVGRGMMLGLPWLRKIPTFYTHHNLVFNFPRILFRLFDHVINSYVAIGEVCAAVLREVTSKNIVVIKNGASASAAARVRSLPSSVDVLSVGWLTRQKDYPTLLDAVASLPVADMPRPVGFRVAGGGALLGDLREQVSARGLDGRVDFLGTRDDVPQLMAQADLLVNCSLYEGLPITLIEAAMAGLPIVATDVGGNREVVVPGVNGILVPPSDPVALAAAIENILSDPENYARLSRGSLEQARDFTIETCATKHLALYREVRRVEPCGG